jgi:hypothetical protein
MRVRELKRSFSGGLQDIEPGCRMLKKKYLISRGFWFLGGDSLNEVEK